MLAMLLWVLGGVLVLALLMAVALYVRRRVITEASR
jgi:hypothetical protein